ncbi:MAG: cytochrome C554 [Bacteroidia bacterium]|nr:MAG: cytochrome C554 [Bacteroidia bacterium]
MKKLLSVITVLLFAGSAMVAQEYKYIGAPKCKMCHNKPATGDQFGKWSAASHSQALKSLSSQASLDYAKKNGIADPTKEASCLKCHSTFHAVDAKLRQGIQPSEGVSCETCHGAGSAYKSPTIMKSQEEGIKNGLIVPDKKLCETCHNPENPFHKPFNYEEALKKIAHPNPAAK